MQEVDEHLDAPAQVTDDLATRGPDIRVPGIEQIQGQQAAQVEDHLVIRGHIALGKGAQGFVGAQLRLQTLAKGRMLPLVLVAREKGVRFSRHSYRPV